MISNSNLRPLTRSGAIVMGTKNHLKRSGAQVWERPTKKQKLNPISIIEDTYSPHRPASEKLTRQLEFAQNQQAKQVAKFVDKRKEYDEDIKSNFHESLQTAISDTQNVKYRKTMEDAYIATTFKVKDVTVKLFGLFDGHGGPNVSKYAANSIVKVLAEQLNKVDQLDDTSITNSLTKTCQLLQDGVPEPRSGSTLLCALHINQKYYFANLGDSRAVFVNDTKTIQLTEDAKPDEDRFKRAIEKAGGKVVKDNNGVSRVNGYLSVARALGPFEDVSARPKITCLEVKDGHLIIACDGLWDVMTTNEAGYDLRKMLEEGFNTTEMAEGFVKLGLIGGSQDNITVMILKV